MRLVILVSFLRGSILGIVTFVKWCVSTHFKHVFRGFLQSVFCYKEELSGLLCCSGHNRMLGEVGGRAGGPKSKGELRASTRGNSCQGNLMPGESHTRGISCQGNIIPGESHARGISCQGILCQGNRMPGESHSRESHARGISYKGNLTLGESHAMGISFLGNLIPGESHIRGIWCHGNLMPWESHAMRI